MDDPLSRLNLLPPSMPAMENASTRSGRTGITGDAARKADEERLAAACAEFESLFINQLLKEMRAAIPKGGLIDGGNAEQIYTAMLDAELARSLAQRGGIGLAKLTRRELGLDPQPGGSAGLDKKVTQSD